MHRHCLQISPSINCSCIVYKLRIIFLEIVVIFISIFMITIAEEKFLILKFSLPRFGPVYALTSHLGP